MVCGSFSIGRCYNRRCIGWLRDWSGASREVQMVVCGGISEVQMPHSLVFPKRARRLLIVSPRHKMVCLGYQCLHTIRRLVSFIVSTHGRDKIVSMNKVLKVTHHVLPSQFCKILVLRRCRLIPDNLICY